MKKRILSILLALALVLTGTIGMAANTIMASDADSEYNIRFELIYEEYVPSPCDNDSDTQVFYKYVYCNDNLVGRLKQTVYWEWDGAYVIDWSLTVSTKNYSNGGFSGVCVDTDDYSANYASWLDCWSYAEFYVYYDEEHVATGEPEIETGHGADGGYWIIK
jgi:hypothetical protein